jgi:hypothetical protein
MAMSPRRYQALVNMSRMGSGPESRAAAQRLAGQRVGANTPVTTRSTGRVMGAIGMGSGASPAGRNLPARRNLPAVSGGVRTPVTMGPTRGLRSPAPAGRGMSTRTKVGLGVAGGLAVGTVMNRSGRGTDSGRSSIYRY